MKDFQNTGVIALLQSAVMGGHASVRDIYSVLRKYVMKKDVNGTKGGLARYISVTYVLVWYLLTLSIYYL